MSTADDAAGLQHQIDDLLALATRNSEQIEGLRGRADAAEIRADSVEERLAVDHEMIAELQKDGVLSREHAEQMEQALASSRIIGAALGILMASRGCDQVKAFAILRDASSRANRPMRDLAQDMVARVDGGETPE